MNTNDAKFLEHLGASIGPVWDAARWLGSRGHRVTVNPTIRCTSHADRMSFIDDGDIHILQRVEVKKRSFMFTDAADFPHADLMICAKHSYDTANPKPLTYLYWNCEQTYLAIVSSYSAAHWTVRPVLDSRYGTWQDCYHCALDCVTFMKADHG